MRSATISALLFALVVNAAPRTSSVTVNDLFGANGEHATSGNLPTVPIGYFVQRRCPGDNTCSGSGHFYQYPQNFCIPYGVGKSCLATCGQNQITRTVFATEDCTGPSTVLTRNLNTCVQSQVPNVFVKDFCPPVNPTPPATFVQQRCGSDSTCKTGKNFTYAQSTCIPFGTGRSCIASCQVTEIVRTVFGTPNCTGTSEMIVRGVDTCTLSESSGVYVKDFCV